jgi:hypothetical protein
VLYLAGELFACRRCCGLAYESQQLSPTWRSVSRLAKIRRRLGGSADVFGPFPEKPRGMHQRTYLRLRARAEAAEAEHLDAAKGFSSQIQRNSAISDATVAIMKRGSP